MLEIDRIDRQILCALGKYARQSYREIAQQIKSKKEVVHYRLKRLEDEGVVWKYVPVFSLSRLGIYAFKIFLRVHGLTKEAEQEMLADLLKNPRINWVARCTGRWDLMISIYACNVLEFAEKKNQLFKRYGTYIEDYSIAILEDALVFNRDYLLEQSTDYRKEFVFGGRPEVEEIDDDEKNIIRAIRNNARYKVTELAKKLDLNVRTVMNKIKDLEKRGIIQGYTTFIRLDKVELQFFKLIVYLQDFTEKRYNELLSFAKQHNNIIHLIKSIGDWELEVELEAENVVTAYEFMKKIRNRFPDIVKLVDVVIITDEMKLDFFPEWY